MMLLERIINRVQKLIFTIEDICIFSYRNRNSQLSTQLDIRYVTSSNLIDVLHFQPESYVKIFQDFIQLGDQGYYAYLDAKCVHRSWVKSNEQMVYPHWAYPMKLKPNQHFIHYCETAPQARGREIYPAVLSKIVEDFKDKGEILMSINDNNKASIKGAKKAGFEERERVKVLVILGMKFIQKQYLES